MQVKLQGPLTGLRVMDVSIMAAGPWTGALLGMLGAEVIKVEPPAGDGTRWVMPTQRGMGTNYVSMNVNKKDIVLDFKTEQGRRDALDLMATCDVFVQNFRGGVIERLKLDYESVKARNPRLIYCAICGFGETGPLSTAGCADPIMQAFSGFARSNGVPQEGVEALRFTGFIDLATAAVATEGILAALLDREVCGEGQKVEVSMLEAALEVQYTRYAELLGTGLVPSPRGSESAAFVPDGAYLGQDREIFITVHNESQWKGFCAALEKPDWLADPRFADNRKRVSHRQALSALIVPVIRSRPAFWWLRVLQRHGVPSSMAHHFETYRHHAQILANDMIARFDTPLWGEFFVGGLPWHFSETPCSVQAPPQSGEHTQEVLEELHGLQATVEEAK